MQTKTVTILGMCISFLLLSSSNTQSSKTPFLTDLVMGHADSLIPQSVPEDLVPTEIVATEVKIKKHTSNSSELECLAKTIFYEAEDQSQKGKWAIADLTISRSKHADFPDTICAVVSQKGQYTPKIRRPGPPKLYNDQRQQAWEESLRIARKALSKPNQILHNEVLFFHAEHVRPNWTSKMRRVAWIDDHLFYAAKKKR